MVVYRYGRPSNRNRRSYGGRGRRLQRLQALLIGGLGASLVANTATAQAHQPPPIEIRSKRPGDRTDEERRLIRAYRRDLLQRREGPYDSDAYASRLAKQAGSMATLTFSDENPLFSEMDVLFSSRPAFADIDGDSDIDLFVGEYYGNIVYFENVGDASNPSFADPSLNPFGLPLLTTFYPSPTFADIDNDGDLDIFIGEYEYGTIFFCENTDDLGAPGFTNCVSEPFGLPTTTAYSYRTPTLADLNDDGDLDMFVGEGYHDGTEIVYYENVGDTGSPNFTDGVTNALGLTSVPENPSPAFVDTDDDGVFDLFVGDNDGDVYYFANVGSTSAPNFTSPVQNGLGFSNVRAVASPAFADIDADGDFDAAVGNQAGFLTYFENEDPSPSVATKTDPTFTPMPLAPFGIGMTLGTGSYDSSPTFADLDNDGDFDALVGTFDGTLLYYENEGNSTNPVFTSPALNNPFGLTDKGNGVAPTFADLDSDGDADVLVGESINVYYFENTWIDGTATGAGPTFSEIGTDAFGLTGFGSNPAFAFVDIDGDCDLDYFIGNGTSSTTGIAFQENTGDPWNPAFGPQQVIASSDSDPLFGLAGFPDQATPTFADVDGDGDPDLLMGADTGDLIFFENTGSAGSAAFAAAMSNPSELRAFSTKSRPSFVDIDGDGKSDAFSGNRTGRLAYFGNLTVPDGATPFRIGLKAFLQGPYSTATDLMSTAVNSEIPMDQPYDGADFTGTPLEYAGSESLVSVPPEAVDWILLQLRSNDPPASQVVEATKAVLLMSDGFVVDTDGLCPAFEPTAGDYYLVIFHRNHLGIVSSQKISLGISGPAVYNFSDASARAFGSSPMATLESGVFGLHGADSGVDGQVTANDFNAWLTDTKAALVGYLMTDFNLDTQVTAGDFNLWLANTKAAVTSKVPPEVP